MCHAFRHLRLFGTPQIFGLFVRIHHGGRNSSQLPANVLVMHQTPSKNARAVQSVQDTHVLRQTMPDDRLEVGWPQETLWKERPYPFRQASALVRLLGQGSRTRSGMFGWSPSVQVQFQRIDYDWNEHMSLHSCQNQKWTRWMACFCWQSR